MFHDKAAGRRVLAQAFHEDLPVDDAMADIGPAILIGVVALRGRCP